MSDHPLRCGRLDKHLAHHWRGPKIYDTGYDRWYAPVYFCTGQVVIEGGHRGVR